MNYHMKKLKIILEILAYMMKVKLIIKKEKKMRKEKDIQKLENIIKVLKEALKNLYDIEHQDEIFNSIQALEVISKYSSISTSLDELLYDLIDYFKELVFIHKGENKMKKRHEIKGITGVKRRV